MSLVAVGCERLGPLGYQQMAVGRHEASEEGAEAAVGSEDPATGGGAARLETTVPGKSAGEPTAAGHSKLSEELRQRIAANREAALEKKATNELRRNIATRKQTAIDKKHFKQWEESIAPKRPKEDDEERTGSGSSCMQTGAAPSSNNAVHAALGRKITKNKKTQKCHFVHTTW